MKSKSVKKSSLKRIVKKRSYQKKSLKRKSLKKKRSYKKRSFKPKKVSSLKKKRSYKKRSFKPKKVSSLKKRISRKKVKSQTGSGFSLSSLNPVSLMSKASSITSSVVSSGLKASSYVKSLQDKLPTCSKTKLFECGVKNPTEMIECVGSLAAGGELCLVPPIDLCLLDACGLPSELSQLKKLFKK